MNKSGQKFLNNSSIDIIIFIYFRVSGGGGGVKLKSQFFLQELSLLPYVRRRLPPEFTRLTGSLT